jgi:hypothetical protein
MENNFLKFAEEHLKRSISQTNILLAKRNSNNKTNVDIVEINNLLFI